jgi:apolipoprotein D and lipocalin family protein
MFPESQGSNYWIMDTDYDNFSLVYLCKNFENGTSDEGIHLLSRTSVLADSVKVKVEGLIDEYFDRNAPVFVTTHHDETCNYE